MNSGADRMPPKLDVSRRSEQPEILDAPVATSELAKVLRDLARFNGAMLGHWPVMRWLKRVTATVPPARPLTFLDVGCGYGDLLRTMRRWARRQGRPVRLIGLDLSTQVVQVARAATDASDEIEYHVANVLDFSPAFPIDIVTSSLVTHHLSDEMIVRFLRWMETYARRGWVIYDLQRSVVPFYFIALAGFLMRLHPVVVYDGRVSVAHSLTRAEWEPMIAKAGIPREAVKIRWFMFRFAIGRVR